VEAAGPSRDRGRGGEEGGAVGELGFRGTSTAAAAATKLRQNPSLLRWDGWRWRGSPEREKARTRRKKGKGGYTKKEMALQRACVSHILFFLIQAII
jgi:hypothetical protein